MIIPLEQTTQDNQKVIDYLTYCSYRHNRNISPNVTVEEWSAIFMNVEQLEERYQKEKTK